MPPEVSDLSHDTQASEPLYLDPPEIPRDFPPDSPLGPIDPSQTLSERWRHASWQTTRKRVYESLCRTMQPVARIHSFSACGSAAFVVKHRIEPDRYRIVGSGCRDRFCLPCARERSRVVVDNVTKYLKHQPVRFLTLTLRHRDVSLSEQLRRLYECFRKLRSSAYWRKHVTGGAAFLEVTLSLNGTWHPHYHCLIQGKYLPRSEVRRLWHEITGDSHIVDVRMARGDVEVIKYITKYVTKSFSGRISRDPEKLDELVAAMYRVRTIIAWGTWRDLQATEAVADTDWEYLCTLEDLVRRASLEGGLWQTVLDTLCPRSAPNLLRDIQHVDAQRGPPPFPRREPDNTQPFLFPMDWYHRPY